MKPIIQASQTSADDGQSAQCKPDVNVFEAFFKLKCIFQILQKKSKLKLKKRNIKCSYLQISQHRLKRF